MSEQIYDTKKPVCRLCDDTGYLISDEECPCVNSLNKK